MNLICPILLWLGVVAFTLIFGSIMAKAFRVYYIFRNLRFGQSVKMKWVMITELSVHCIRIYVHTFGFVHMHMYTYTCTHACVHTFTNTLLQPFLYWRFFLEFCLEDTYQLQRYSINIYACGKGRIIHIQNTSMYAHTHTHMRINTLYLFPSTEY